MSDPAMTTDTTTDTTPTQTSANRRIATRYRPAFGTVCRYRPRGTGDEPGSIDVGLVWNISVTGVSMLITETLERGIELDAELASESGDVGLHVVLRVVHIRESPTGDFFLGAQFVRPLESDELQRFLTPHALPPIEPAPDQLVFVPGNAPA